MSHKVPVPYKKVDFQKPTFRERLKDEVLAAFEEKDCVEGNATEEEPG